MPDEIHHIEIIGTGMRTLGISTVSDVRACSSVASTGDAATSAKAVDQLSYREFIDDGDGFAVHHSQWNDPESRRIILEIERNNGRAE